MMMPACHAHPAALHAGDAHQPHVLRKAGVRKGVEQAADHRAQAVGAQPGAEFGWPIFLPRDVGQRQEHAGGFDHHHHHHQAHGQDHQRVENRHAKGKGRDHVKPVRLGHLVKTHLAHQHGQYAAGHDAQQHRDVGNEARA
jgi:hypothetical protein